MTDAEKREKVVRGLECCIIGDPDDSRECKKCPYRRNGITNEPCFNALHADALALLKEQETIPSYNDAVDTIKFQSKVLGLACEILAGWESEDPCNTLLYIKEQREKCEDRCCCDKTPDEWCWRRYLALMVTEDSPTPEQMRETPWEGEDDG